MQELRANTAVDVLIGPHVEDGDGDSALTALTLVVELSKNGQGLATKNDATDPVHDSGGTVDGYYNCELDATDTNAEGTLTLVTHHAEALPIKHDYMVLSMAAWDSKYVAKDTGYMDVNVKAVSEDTAAADNLESACDNYSVTRGLSGTALPAAAADASGGLIISDDGGFDADELYDAIVTDATGANIAIDIIALKAETVLIVEDTDELQTDWVNGGRLDLILDIIDLVTTTVIPGLIGTAQADLDLLTGADGATLATLQGLYAPNVVVPDAAGVAATPAEVATALTDIHLDHLFHANYDPAAKPGSATALLNELVENDGGVSRFTENSLEQAPSGTGASAATIADAVWDEDQADHVGVGTFGVTASEIADIPTTAEFEARTIVSAAYVVVGDTIAGVTSVTDVAGDVKGNVDGTVAGKTPSEAGDAMNLAADAIKAVSYDESTAFPVKSSDAGASQIARVGADGDTLEDISDEIAAVKAETATIVADTNELQTDDYPTLIAAVQTTVDAIETDTGTTLENRLIAIEADTDVIDDGTSGLVKIASDVAAVLVDTSTTLQGELDGIQTDTEDIQSRLPAALVTGRMSSDAVAISGSTDAADKLEASAETIVIGTVSHDNSAASTTVFYSDDITEATADHFNGRIVIFTSGALLQQATDITDYELASGEGKFTVTALTEAPVDNVTFVIV